MASWTRKATMAGPLRLAAWLAALVMALLAGGWSPGAPASGERSSSSNASPLAQSAPRERGRLAMRREVAHTAARLAGLAETTAQRDIFLRQDHDRLERSTGPKAVQAATLSNALDAAPPQRAADDFFAAAATRPAFGQRGAAPGSDIEPRCASPPKVA